MYPFQALPGKTIYLSTPKVWKKHVFLAIFSGKMMSEMLYQPCTGGNPTLKSKGELFKIAWRTWRSQRENFVKNTGNPALKKASNETNLIKKLLADCKSWNRPFTSGDEMMRIIKSQPDQEEFIVKTESTYFAHTHKSDKIQ